jgi:hypothetical protein
MTFHVRSLEVLLFFYSKSYMQMDVLFSTILFMLEGSESNGDPNLDAHDQT